MQVLQVVASAAIAVLFFLPAKSYASAQAPNSPSEALALVRRATQNELANSAFANHPLRYKLRKADIHGVTTKDVIQTRDGSVSRLLAIGDKVLTPEQEQVESDRLERLLNTPAAQERRKKRETEDAERVLRLLQILPNAFIFTPEGVGEGQHGPYYRLAFRPNPRFTPPTREAQVYHGMAGELWIDKNQERMTRLDAHLITDVDFGWGIIGRLNKGGVLVLEQADIGGHRWETTYMRLSITGKALMFKALRFDLTDNMTDFQAVSAMGYREAIKILLTGKPQPTHP